MEVTATKYAAPHQNECVLRFEAKAFDDPVTGKLVMEGFAATSHLDLTQYLKGKNADRILKSAHEKIAQWLMDYPTVLFNHDLNAPIGKMIETSVEPHPEGNNEWGTRIKYFISDAPGLEDIRVMAREGVLCRHSFKFLVPDGGARIVFDQAIKKNVREISDIVAIEATLTSVPMQHRATAAATAKSAEEGLEDAVIDWKAMDVVAVSKAAQAGDSDALSSLNAACSARGVSSVLALPAEPKGWGDVAMGYLWQLVDVLDSVSKWEELDEVMPGLRAKVALRAQDLRADLGGTTPAATEASAKSTEGAASDAPTATPAAASEGAPPSPAAPTGADASAPQVPPSAPAAQPDSALRSDLEEAKTANAALARRVAAIESELATLKAANAEQLAHAKTVDAGITSLSSALDAAVVSAKAVDDRLGRVENVALPSNGRPDQPRVEPQVGQKGVGPVQLSPRVVGRRSH